MMRDKNYAYLSPAVVVVVPLIILWICESFLKHWSTFGTVLLFLPALKSFETKHDSTTFPCFVYISHSFFSISDDGMLH